MRDYRPRPLVTFVGAYALASAALDSIRDRPLAAKDDTTPLDAPAAAELPPMSRQQRRYLTRKGRLIV